MSYWLAMDTATDLGTVAIGRGGGPAFAELSFADRRHAAALMPAVAELLRMARLSLPQLDGIVVADGPGSFTGLRIGFATALGIVRSVPQLRCRTAPSLLVTAWSVRAFATGPVAALYDAMRGEVFGAVYEPDDRRVTTLLPPTLGRLEELMARSPTRPALVAGDGTVGAAALVREWSGREPVPPPAGAPRAGALLELLDIEGGSREIEALERFEPDYGRKAEAQVRWEQAHGRPLPDPRPERG